MNFPQTHYEMSSDTAHFVPPERYPSPPRDMWYEVPKTPRADPKEKPKPLFPWETHQPRPTRVFAHPVHPEPPAAEPMPASAGGDETSPGSQTQGELATAERPQTPPGPASRTALSASTNIWSSFPRTNAWDSVPEINRYVDRTLQKHRRTLSRNLGLGGGQARAGAEADSSFGRRGSKVTDFPSEDDRPSLPVTPAPIRRPRRWGSGGPGGLGGNGDGEEEEQLPAAEGVPGQADWVCVHGIWWSPADCLCELTNILRYYKDPAAQLQKLAREQSELLFQRLGSGGEGDQEEEERHEIPSRALPFGSENVSSPTYVPAAPPVVVSPTPVKPHTGMSPVNRILAAAPEIMSSELQAAPRTMVTQEDSGSSSVIPAPSYRGPGAAFEKGEDIPTFETPMPPTEEERDVLET
jgi:glycogenin